MNTLCIRLKGKLKYQLEFFDIRHRITNKFSD